MIHYTAMTSAEAAVARLCDPEAEVSAHYLISACGEIVQMVPEDMRAWHAGVGSWGGVDDINSRSIGIELDNRGSHPFAARQMDALDWLLRGILERWDIPPDGVIGHSDMAPGRKQDPGRFFDWARLTRQGLAGPTVFSPAKEITVARFLEAAACAGYPCDGPFDALLEAARARFAPWRYGPLVPEDLNLGASPSFVGPVSPPSDG